jgi:hypothetical protein
MYWRAEWADVIGSINVHKMTSHCVNLVTSAGKDCWREWGWCSLLEKSLQLLKT